MAQAMAGGAQEVTPLQPAAESKPEDKKEGDADVVSTLKKSQEAAAERDAGEQVPSLPSERLLCHTRQNAALPCLLKWYHTFRTGLVCELCHSIPLVSQAIRVSSECVSDSRQVLTA